MHSLSKVWSPLSPGVWPFCPFVLPHPLFLCNQPYCSLCLWVCLLCVVFIYTFCRSERPERVILSTWLPVSSSVRSPCDRNHRTDTSLLGFCPWRERSLCIPLPQFYCQINWHVSKKFPNIHWKYWPSLDGYLTCLEHLPDLPNLLIGPLSGHVQEATSECVSKWNRSLFVCLCLCPFSKNQYCLKTMIKMK